MGKKPIVSVTNQNERISNKKQITLLKICVTSLLCSPRVDLWPFYGRFTGFYVNGFLSCKTRGLHRRDVTLILSKVSCFYWNPFIFVGYRNDFFFPIQILIFRMLRNNAEPCRCSYFELGLPLSYLTSVSFCYDLDCLPFPVTNIKNLI